MRNTKKRIGIIGGVGPQATAILYQKIIKYAQEKHGAKNNNDFPSVIIESVPVPDFISNQDKMQEAKLMLENSVQRLNQAGTTKLAIASNTVHLLLEDLQKNSEANFISMIDVVAAQCKDYQKVGILASPVTIKCSMYDKSLSKYQVELIKPNDQDTIVVDKMIRHVLAGTDNRKEKSNYVRILNQMYDEGAESVILACTELPLAINYEALGKRVISSMSVLAEELADYYYN